MSRKTKELEREERRKKVAANLKAGLNYREIAEHLGVSLGTISNDVNLVIERWQKEHVSEINEYVSLELKRLDQAQNAIWGEVMDGKLLAIDRLLKIQRRRADLLGLDAPEKHQLTGEAGGPMSVQYWPADDEE